MTDEKLYEALNKNIEAQNELIKVFKDQNKIQIKEIVDLIERKEAKNWQTAFNTVLGFLLILVTLFLGFLNS